MRSPPQLSHPQSCRSKYIPWENPLSYKKASHHQCKAYRFRGLFLPLLYPRSKPYRFEERQRISSASRPMYRCRSHSWHLPQRYHFSFFQDRRKSRRSNFHILPTSQPSWRRRAQSVRFGIRLRTARNSESR